MRDSSDTTSTGTSGSSSGSSYLRTLGGAIPADEQRRLDLQSGLYARLARWTFDQLALAPGGRVLELGCGTGELLRLAAERVGPRGQVIGIDADAGVAATARERTADMPWVRVLTGDAATIAFDGEPFDAAHCRLVLMHQHGSFALLDRMRALVRRGGRVAAQELDVDGPTGQPAMTSHPPLPAFDELARVYLATSLARGSDPQTGRALLHAFRRAGFDDLACEAAAAVFPLTDARADVPVGLFTRPGAAERSAGEGIMPLAAYQRLARAVRAARDTATYDTTFIRGWTLVSVVGRVPVDAPSSRG